MRVGACGNGCPGRLHRSDAHEPNFWTRDKGGQRARVRASHAGRKGVPFACQGLRVLMASGGATGAQGEGTPTERRHGRRCPRARGVRIGERTPTRRGHGKQGTAPVSTLGCAKVGQRTARLIARRSHVRGISGSTASSTESASLLSPLLRALPGASPYERRMKPDFRTTSLRHDLKSNRKSRPPTRMASAQEWHGG